MVLGFMGFRLFLGFMGFRVLGFKLDTAPAQQQLDHMYNIKVYTALNLTSCVDCH